jgi:hypothetical protein
LRRWSTSSRPVFRTDVHGDIEISTDGARLWVEVEGEGE